MVLICTSFTNQTIVPWTIINVEPSINFEELLIQIKSEAFSTTFSIVETFFINIGFWQDKSTDT